MFHFGKAFVDDKEVMAIRARVPLHFAFLSLPLAPAYDIRAVARRTCLSILSGFGAIVIMAILDLFLELYGKSDSVDVLAVHLALSPIRACASPSAMFVSMDLIFSNTRLRFDKIYDLPDTIDCIAS